jgi:hypothetical protein
MAYKVFTNGSPLPASDLNTYLMNQSVMVFANSTARSAALTAPTEGMVTYLEDTNKVEVYTGSPLAWTDINDNSAAIPKSTVTTAGDLIVANGNASVTRLGIGSNGQILTSNGTTATWTTVDTPDSVITTEGDLIIGDASGDATRLGIGTNGQVLTSNGTTATWAASGGGGLNWSQISAVSPTGTKTVSFTSLSGKDNYWLLFEALSFVADSNLFVRINGDTAANYYYYGYRFADTSSYGTNTIRNYSSGADDRFYLGYCAVAANTISGGLQISGGNAAGQKLVDGLAMGGAGNDSEGFIWHGRWAGSSTITSIDVYTDISNFDAGTVRLMGA